MNHKQQYQAFCMIQYCTTVHFFYLILLLLQQHDGPPYTNALLMVLWESENEIICTLLRTIIIGQESIIPAHHLVDRLFD